MKWLLLILVLLFPLPAISEGLLNDAAYDLGKIAKDKSLNREISQDVSEVSAKIRRASLAQELQEEALTNRIVELENTVHKQQEIIVRYEKVVAELEAKIKQASR